MIAKVRNSYELFSLSSWHQPNMLMKFQKLIYLQVISLVILILNIVGCSNNGGENISFTQIHDLIENNPDSALYLLENYESVSSLNKRDKAQYYLTLTRARDFKEQDLFLSDSIINLALDLLSPRKDIELTAQALLYKGRIAAGFGEYEKAANYYDEAISILPKEEPYYKTLSKAYSYLGQLHFENLSLKEALISHKINLSYASKTLDHELIAMALHNIGIVFFTSVQMDSALFYYNEVLDLTNNIKISKTTKDALYENLSAFYSSNGDFESSLKY